MRDHTKLNREMNQSSADNPLIDDAPERPVAPLHLSYEARKFYNEVIQSLPVDWFHSADLALFEMYCQTYADYKMFLRKIDESGQVYEDSKGILRQVPWVAMADKSKAFLLTASGKLKINPKSRDGDSVKRSAAKAATADTIKKSGRRGGLMFIPGGKKD